MTPKTLKELVRYIAAEHAKAKAAEDNADNYNAATQYAANVAIAAFNYAANREGLTGFQASWASLRVFAVMRDLKGPFAIISADRMLYPQHDTPSAEAREYEKKWRPWLKKEATRLLTENAGRKGTGVAPMVWAHWEALAAFDEGES